jgi:thioesterase domain-containing protein
MGGVVALEMARQLEERGEQVAALVLIDTAPASPARSYAVDDDLPLIGHFAHDVGLLLSESDISPEAARALDTDELLALLLERAKLGGLVPPDVGLADARLLFRVFKSNMFAYQRYVPRPVACPVFLFRASERGGEAPPDAAGVWGDGGGSRVVVKDVPGNHYSILREPNVEALAEELRTALAAAPSPGDGGQE